MGEVEKVFENISEVKVPINKEKPINKYKHTDLEWPQYVMEQFDQSELDKGYPKVDGLRRVTELLMGEILESCCNIVQAPTENSGATAEYEIVLRTEDGTVKRYSDAADAGTYNIKGEAFSVFPTAIAVTRAEARVLRKILRLKTVAAEELSEPPTEEVAKINDTQLNVIDKLCAFQNIDVVKLLEGACKTNKKKNFTALLSSEAASIIRELGQYKNTDESLLGYNPNWRG